MGPCDIKTIVSYNQPKEMYCDLSLGKFDLKLNYYPDSLYIGFHSQSLTRFWLGGGGKNYSPKRKT